MSIPPFERRFLLLSAGTLSLLAALLCAFQGWRGGLAALLTGGLVTADFLWLARGLRLVVSPGPMPPPGALRSRALWALVGRNLLLLLGLYGILKILPGRGVAMAAGLGVPLAALALAALGKTRS